MHIRVHFAGIAFTNFDSKHSHMFFTTTDTSGNIGKDYAKLISFIARIQHPGEGVDGQNDVDGLHSQAVAFARYTVARHLHDHFVVGLSAKTPGVE